MNKQNIMLEFTRKDKRFNASKLMSDFFKHVEDNWYRLVEYGMENNKVRIYSTFSDIYDVVTDYKNCKRVGYTRIKEDEN